MLYMFFDTAVNGYYSLSLLKKEFASFLPLLPNEEKISDDVAPFIFSIELNQIEDILNAGIISLKEVILLKSNEPIQVVQSHFSKFTVQTIKEKQFYFRFWSESVFRKFIASCNANQLTEFFGPVQEFICRNEGPSFSWSFYFDGTRLIKKRSEAIKPGSPANNNETIGSVPLKNTGDVSGEVTVELKAQRPARRFFD